MSAEVRQSSFYLRLLINSVPLSLCLFPAFPSLSFGQSCISSLTIYLSLGTHSPPFVPISFVSFCLLIWLPDTRLTWQPVIRFVLWCPRAISEEGWNTEQVVNTCFHRCCFDKVQIVHIKASFSILSGLLCSPS